MRVRLRILQFTILAFVSPMLAFANAIPAIATESLNPEATELAILNGDCEQLILLQGWMTKTDLNGDGLKDYIFVYSVECNGFKSTYCGSAGCLTRVWYGVEPGKWTLALSQNIRRIVKSTFEGKLALRISEHSVFCEKAGVEGCETIRVWNGKTLQTVWSDY